MPAPPSAVVPPLPSVADLAAMTPLFQCAESKVYRVRLPDGAGPQHPNDSGAAAASAAVSPLAARSYIVKHRFPKAYRHPKLDAKLREQRTAREARALVRAACKTGGGGAAPSAGSTDAAGVRVPTVLYVNKADAVIVMEDIAGVTLKEVLDELQRRRRCAAAAGPAGQAPRGSLGGVGGAEACLPTRLIQQVLRGIGEIVGLLHAASIIHGDLTTSNILLQHGLAGAAEAGSGPLVESAIELYTASQRHALGLPDDSAEAAAEAGEVGAVPPGLSALASLVAQQEQRLSVGGPRPARDNMVVLDFGLVTDKKAAEEKAVDLYVLERALSSTHPSLLPGADPALQAPSPLSSPSPKSARTATAAGAGTFPSPAVAGDTSNAPRDSSAAVGAAMMDFVLEGYRRCAGDPKAAQLVIAHLDKVRARGRKRSMVG